MQTVTRAPSRNDETHHVPVISNGAGPDRRMPRATSIGEVLRWSVAALLMGAAGIHFAMMGEHAGVSWTHGVFFGVAAWLQIALAVAVIRRRPSRVVIGAVVLVNIALLDVWILTRTVGIAIGKAVLFVALMMFVGSRVVPFILGRVVHTRSRELFVLVALTMAVGTALASAQYFGVSLALGAFVAGIIVSESPFSHQIGADLLPFREAFAVIFFVSVGMLVNPMYVAANWDRLLLVVLVIVFLKALVSGVLATLLGCSARTTLVVAAGRGQIGEFSFIVGQSGLALGLSLRRRLGHVGRVGRANGDAAAYDQRARDRCRSETRGGAVVLEDDQRHRWGDCRAALGTGRDRGLDDA